MGSLTLAEKMTPDEARQILEAEQRERLEQCHAEIQAVCKKYKLNLVAQISVVDGRIVAVPVLTNAA